MAGTGEPSRGVVQQATSSRPHRYIHTLVIQATVPTGLFTLFKLEPVIRMSHENISVIFQKLQICPSSSVFVYLSHKAQVECQPRCLLHSVMQFQNQNKFQTTGAYLQ